MKNKISETETKTAQSWSIEIQKIPKAMLRREIVETSANRSK